MKPLGKIPAYLIKLHLVRTCHIVNQSQLHPDPLLSAQAAGLKFRWQVLNDTILWFLELQKQIPTNTDEFLFSGFSGIGIFWNYLFHMSLIKKIIYCYCLFPHQCTRLVCFGHAGHFMQEFVKSVGPKPSLAGPVNPDNEIKVAAGARWCSLVWIRVRGILPEFQSS